MKIKIYQIKDQENRRKAAERLVNRPPLTAPGPVDETMYHRVFMGDVDCESPYDILFQFNTEGHRLFRGDRMTISDVVEMETDAGKLTLLYDSLGVSVIEFDAGKVQKADNLLRVLVIEPHRVPYESEIENTLEGEQAAVEGQVQYLHNGDGTIIVANDDGKMIGMEGNRRIDGDVLVGPVFIAGDTGEALCSLSDEQLRKYAERFAEPEEIREEEVAEYCFMRFIPF